MGAEGAAEIVFRREIDTAEDKNGRRMELVNEYRETFSNPYVAAGRRWSTTSLNLPRPENTWPARLSRCTPSGNCGRKKNTG